MDELVDFEEFIDINEVLVSMEKELQNISQCSLIDALDKMCDVEDGNNNTEVTTANADKELTVGENTDSTDDVINLDNVQDILNELQMSVNTIEKLEQREFSITDINTEISKEKNDKVVDDNSMAKVTPATCEISEKESVIDLDEFETIFNEICVSNDKMENSESILRDTKIETEKPGNLHTFIDVDKMNDGNNDNNRAITDNLGSNCAQANTVEDKVTETLKQIKPENVLIIDLDSTESDTDSNNLSKDQFKEDAAKVVSKETDIISLSSDSDDGYNSSDFEFISESEAKKKCLANTDIQNYSYYNADFMKYHRSRYLPCRVTASKASRKSHVVPQGEKYLDLFRGMYAPAVMNNLYHGSKKRVLPVTSMTLQDGFRFDVYENKGEEYDEYKHEANESLKKIRFLYPKENRKRRRF